MQSVNRTYLGDIIFRIVNKTILIRRLAQNPSCYVRNTVASEEEITDFIQSIPYFDKKLKNFLKGKLSEDTVIISQAWETIFVTKASAWAANCGWLHENPLLSIGLFTGNIQPDKNLLTLPY